MIIIYKNIIMGIIKEIIQLSAIGALSKWHKAFILLLFSVIVVTLLTMLTVLIVNGNSASINFGYLYHTDY